MALSVNLYDITPREMPEYITLAINGYDGGCPIPGTKNHIFKLDLSRNEMTKTLTYH
jgi:hypothetical protein